MMYKPTQQIPQTSRRRFLKFALAGAGAIAAVPAFRPRAAEAASEVPADLDFASDMYPFELPPLPYAFDALEPSIDARTMEIHYSKHHAGYVRKLNMALENHPELHSKSLGELLTDLDALPEDIRTAVRNNGGGHLNHSLFWYTLANPETRPSADLESAIESAFGDIEGLDGKMVSAGLGRFGSGWAWLCARPDGELFVTSTPNQDNPIMEDPTVTPLLGVDVWEHAYYLKYQNKRGDYLKAWTDIIDWANVSKRLALT